MPLVAESISGEGENFREDSGWIAEAANETLEGPFGWLGHQRPAASENDSTTFSESLRGTL